MKSFLNEHLTDERRNHLVPARRAVRSIRKAVLLTAAVAAFGVAATGWSAPITLSYAGPVNGYKTGNITTPLTGGVSAGQFKFDVISGGGGWDNTLQAFCIDINNWLVTSGNVTYDITPAEATGGLSGLKLAQVSWLFDNHVSSLGNTQNDVAFQLTLWEVLFETNGTLNLSSGAFKSDSFGGARAAANDLLTGITTDQNYKSESWEFFVLNASDPIPNQGLITWREKPNDPHEISEPGTLLLLSIGLGVAFFSTRRRNSLQFASLA